MSSYSTHIQLKNVLTPFVFIKKNYFIKLIQRNFKVKIDNLTVELYFNGQHFYSQFFPILPELNDFSIKDNVSIKFSFIKCVKYQLIWTQFSAQTWSLSAKKANIGFFAPKPYLKGVDRNLLFDRKFCLVEILKR